MLKIFLGRKSRLCSDLVIVTFEIILRIKKGYNILTTIKVKTDSYKTE